MPSGSPDIAIAKLRRPPQYKYAPQVRRAVLAVGVWATGRPTPRDRDPLSLASIVANRISRGQALDRPGLSVKPGFERTPAPTRSQRTPRDDRRSGCRGHGSPLDPRHPTWSRPPVA